MKSCCGVNLLTHFAVTGLIAISTSFPVHASGLPFDPSNFPDPAELVPKGVVGPVVEFVGAGTQHRSFDSAAAPGDRASPEIGVEVTLFKITEKLVKALGKAGMETDLPIQALPLPRLHLRQGLGSKASVGFSFVRLLGYKVYGGDLKINLSSPEEGLSWALRTAYTYSSIGFVTASTWSPQLLISKPMPFADPYLGIGAQITSGKITVEVDEDPDTGTPLPEPLELSGKSLARGYFAFMGVVFRMSTRGLQLALEGSYNGAGTHTIGAKLGLRF